MAQSAMIPSAVALLGGPVTSTILGGMVGCYLVLSPQEAPMCDCQILLRASAKREASFY